MTSGFDRFECPAPLLAQGIFLRPETKGDVAALRQIHFAHRRDEFALLPMSEARLTALVDSQFDMQRRHYMAQYPDGLFLALVDRDETIGRFYLAREERTVLILDILIRADRRGAGLGSILIDALLAQTAALDLGVSLHVSKMNRAAQLYERLGFRVAGENEIDWLMEARGRGSLKVGA